MSRAWLPRAERDLFSRHSERIARALELQELDFLTYGVLSFLVDKIELPGRNGEVLYTLEELARALDWPLKNEQLRRRMHGLKDAGWIAFEDPRRGPKAPWIIRLSGAAIDGERDESLAVFDQSFLAGRPTREETISTGPEESEHENLHSEPVPESSEFPRRARVERSRAKNLLDEELDHVLGKTTTRVRVEQAEDGSLEPTLEEALLDEHLRAVYVDPYGTIEEPAA